MKYALLIYAEESVIPEMSDEERARFFEGYGEYNTRATKAGVFVAAMKLEDSHAATTRRVRGTDTLTIDGPFAETKEQLAGAYIVECDNLDEALRWADELPGARIGSIEVRPIQIFGANG